MQFSSFNEPIILCSYQQLNQYDLIDRITLDITNGTFSMVCGEGQKIDGDFYGTFSCERIDDTNYIHFIYEGECKAIFISHHEQLGAEFDFRRVNFDHPACQTLKYEIIREDVIHKDEYAVISEKEFKVTFNHPPFQFMSDSNCQLSYCDIVKRQSLVEQGIGRLDFLPPSIQFSTETVYYI